MLKKQRPVRRQGKNSFLTQDFLEKQKTSLETELANCQKLQKLARQEIKICSFDEKRGDLLEQALTQGEKEIVARRLKECGKTISQVKKALGLINNLLAGEKNGENYGMCVDCERLIPRRRLEAVPWAERCVPCQEKKDVG